MKIKCAIFDFDGTLFDSMYIWDNLAETYLNSLGKKAKSSIREDVKALSLYQSANYLKKEYNLSLSAEEIIAGINKTIEHFYIHNVLPKPGVIDFLEKMKNAEISMCIATASDRYHVETALSRCGMKHYFDAIFTCNEIGYGKDEPVIFRKAMEYFVANRSNTIVFEDAFHSIQTAKNDGFTVAAVFDSSEKRQNEIRNLADFYFTDFEHTDNF